MNTPHAWRTVMFAAMENGINSFELAAGIDVMALGVGEALRSVERRLLFLGWRLRGDSHHHLTAEAIMASVRGGLQKTGAEYFDVLMIDESAFETLDQNGRKYLDDLRTSGRCRQIGIAGDGPVVDAAIQSSKFDVLTTPFNLTSDWQVRRRIREAADRNMVIVACDPFPSAQIRQSGPPSLLRGGGLLSRTPSDPLAGTGTYQFLHQTSNWTAEDLCLGYLFTEPSLATVLVESFRAESIARIAAVPDRDLPTGVAAQIEMARFSADKGDRRRA